MRGLHSTEVAFLTLIQWPRVRFSAFTKHFKDVAKIYRRRWFEESGQRFDNVDQTHQKHLSRQGIKEVNLTTDVVDFRLFSESDVNFVASRRVTSSSSSTLLGFVPIRRRSAGISAG